MCTADRKGRQAGTPGRPRVFTAVKTGTRAIRCLYRGKDGPEHATVFRMRESVARTPRKGFLQVVLADCLPRGLALHSISVRLGIVSSCIDVYCVYQIDARGRAVQARSDR